MKSELDVRITSAIAIVMFVCFGLYKGFEVSELWGIFANALTATVISRSIFIRWLWKWMPFKNLFLKVPYIAGNWTGNYESTWNAKTEHDAIKGEVEVVISQPDIFKVKVTQKTEESISHSYGEIFEFLEDGQIYLNFSYRNDPKATMRGRSELSYGSARYYIEITDSEQKMSGNYWTDRKSTGSVSIKKI